MENLIPNKNINNRKIIIEIRFNSNPLIIDKRGELVKKLINDKVIKNAEWELGGGELKILDNLDVKQAKNIIFIGLNRISIISTKIDSNTSFFNQFEKSYKALKDLVGDLEIIRIGCRILGTYEAKSKNYNSIVKNFKNYFNTSIFLEDFNVTDLVFSIVYDNGRYMVGPISKEDSFLEREFNTDDCIKSIGFGIDTDNYFLNDDPSNKVSDSKIKDVFVASISVEKSLFDKLSLL